MASAQIQQQIDNSNRNLAAVGVMLVIFLFAIDATIVSTSMPTIVARLGGLELYSWVFSIYMLTSALTTPIFGKLADLYSKRRLMLIGIAIFLHRLDPVRRGPEHGSDDRLPRRPRTRRRRDLRAVVYRHRRASFPPTSAPRCRASSAASGAWHRSSVRLPAASSSNTASWRWIFFVNLPLIAIATAAHRHRTQRERRASAAATKLDLVGAARFADRPAAHFLRPGAERPRPIGDHRRNRRLHRRRYARPDDFLFHRAARRRTDHAARLFAIGLYKASTVVATL